MMHHTDHKPYYWIAGAILVIISLLFYLLYGQHNIRFDAYGYFYMIAPFYAKKGLFAMHPLADLRTYFYPWVLSIFLQLSHAISIRPLVLIFILQTLLYCASIIYLSRSISRLHEKLGLISLFLMSLNIYLIPYLSITLTDALYTTLVIFWMGAIITLHQTLTFEKNEAQTYLAILIALFVSSVALVIRPASIWLSILTVLILLYFLPKINKNAKSSSVVLWLLPIAILVYLSPLLPQIYINHVYFGKWSPLPAVDLGQQQLNAGIHYLKYGTSTSTQSPYMFYLNPFFNGEKGTLDISWYFKNPINAVATLLSKSISAFDFDHLLPYIHNLKPWYRWISGFFSLSIFYFGLWGALSYTFSKTNKVLFFGPHFFPLICLIGWGSIALLSMYELRFGLPMLTLFLIFSAERMLHLQKMNKVARYQSLAIYLLSMSILLSIAGYVAKQNILLR